MYVEGLPKTDANRSTESLDTTVHSRDKLPGIASDTKVLLPKKSRFNEFASALTTKSQEPPWNKKSSKPLAKGIIVACQVILA